jgi:acetyl esterase/lipase
MPGGGFNAVVLTSEGTELCDWLTIKGITCVLLKYRVPKSDRYGDSAGKQFTPKVPRALQDAQRSIRLVRSMAKELSIDPNRIGAMGFSAGGYMVVRASNIFEPAYTPVDAIDTISRRPDFVVALYPGHLCDPGGKLNPTVHVTEQTPPTFMLAAWNDPVDDICNSTVYAQALAASGAKAEVHFFAKGGHAFGLRYPERREAMWPSLVESWLKEMGIL